MDRKMETLDDLFEGYSDEYFPEEIDAGLPVGHEIITDANEP